MWHQWQYKYILYISDDNNYIILTTQDNEGSNRALVVFSILNDKNENQWKQRRYISNSYTIK